MGLTVTLWIGAVALAVALFCGWRGARAPDLNRGPRMVPWQLLMMLAGAAFVMMAVHTAALLGLTTATQ
jgi:hypothetical protein